VPIRMNWGTGSACAYALFAVSTLGMVAFAMTQPVELVSGDYYQRSLELDRRMEATANARALGPALELWVDADNRSITVQVPETPAITGGAITLYRPSSEAADRHVPFEPARGRQVVETAGLLAGRWVVKIEWSAAGRPFYHEAVVSLP
jgi:nitrogen fixation protein FixH